MVKNTDYRNLKCHIICSLLDITACRSFCLSTITTCSNLPALLAVTALVSWYSGSSDAIVTRDKQLQPSETDR